MITAARMALATALRRNGSVTFAAKPRNAAPTSKDDPPPPRLFFFPAPGSRLISIMRVSPLGSPCPSSGGVAERQADWEHHQGRDLVRDERSECPVTHLQVRQRIRLLDANAHPVTQRFGEPGDARAAAAGVDAAQLAARPRRRGEEGRRTLDADRDLLAAALDDRIQMRRPVIALDQLVRFVRADAALALQVLAE